MYHFFMQVVRILEGCLTKKHQVWLFTSLCCQSIHVVCTYIYLIYRRVRGGCGDNGSIQQVTKFLLIRKIGKCCCHPRFGIIFVVCIIGRVYYKLQIYNVDITFWFNNQHSMMGGMISGFIILTHHACNSFGQ